MIRPSRRRHTATAADSHQDNHTTPVPFSVSHPTGWLVSTVARAVWRRFRDDCRAIAPAAWRAWITALSVGFALTLTLTVGLVFLGQSLQARGLQTWDIQTLRW